MQVFFDMRDKQFYMGSMASYPYPLHIHEGIEIACILSGTCSVMIDHKPYTLSAGDFVIIFPMIPHSFDNLSPDCDGFASLFLPETIAEFTHTFHTLLPDDPIVRGATLNHDVQTLINRLRAMAIEEFSPYQYAYLHLLLAHMLHQMTFHPANASSEHSLATQIIFYIHEHACENITLSSTAHALGISTSHLSRLFSTQFHINFRRFINVTRINKALEQMCDPEANLTQICYGCGYENMRTFRRAFVQATNVLPSDYIRQLHQSTITENGST